MVSTGRDESHLWPPGLEATGRVRGCSLGIEHALSLPSQDFSVFQSTSMCQGLHSVLEGGPHTGSVQKGEANVTPLGGLRRKNPHDEKRLKQRTIQSPPWGNFVAAEISHCKLHRTFLFPFMFGFTDQLRERVVIMLQPLMSQSHQSSRPALVPRGFP